MGASACAAAGAMAAPPCAGALLPRGGLPLALPAGLPAPPAAGGAWLALAPRLLPGAELLLPPLAPA